MAIMGLSSTDRFNSPAGRRPQNFREGILMLYPNGGGIEKAPLTALTAVMKSAPTDDPIYHWFTKTLQDRRFKLAASLDTGPAGAVQSISVDSTYASALGLKGGDLLLVEQTQEILYVQTTPSAAGTISVIRGFQYAAATVQTAVVYNGAAINPYIKVIGSAFEEGSAAPDPTAFDPVEISNQTQIFRGTYGLTGTAQQTNTRTGDEEKELKRQALENFGVDMEMGFFFGQKTTTIRNGYPLRTTAGIMGFIPGSRQFVPAAGTITMAQFEAWSVDIFRYGSTEKLVFCGSTFMTALAQMLRKNVTGQYHLGDAGTEYGMGPFRKLITPNGTMVIKVHPLFSQMVGGLNGGAAFTSMDNAAIGLDMSNVRYRFLRNRDVKFQDNLQLPGVDAKLAGWIGECGLEVNHPYTHFYISGVVKGGADT